MNRKDRGELAHGTRSVGSARCGPLQSALLAMLSKS